MKLLKEYIAKLINENLESPILDDNYFMRRVPFFKGFENDSEKDEVKFSYYKNWQGENAAVLHFGKEKGFVKFPFFSVEIKFFYYPVKKRDFNSNEPKFIMEHNFIYKTDVGMTLPSSEEIENIPNKIVSLMFKDIMENEMKFKTSFEVKEGEEFPKQTLDKVINDINKNLFNIEEVLSKMNLSYFND